MSKPSRKPHKRLANTPCWPSLDVALSKVLRLPGLWGMRIRWSGSLGTAQS